MAKVNNRQDTIAAIATSLGEGAVGIVRLSGPCAIAIAEEVFLSKKRGALSGLATFSLRYGWIVRDKKSMDTEGFSSKEFKEGVLDEVVVSLMRAPHSYTKEDVVEINTHGGSKVLASILELVLEKGARVAQPGEFTKRAFLNGRIDLTQAEAVLDIIQAKSQMALKNSLAQLSGDVSRCIKALSVSLLDILADMEARLDFPEEEQAFSESHDFSKRLCLVADKLKNLLEHSFQGRIIREGLKVVIYGKPNVGKSSLLNALLKQERAIVTSIAGTTRDTIEESIAVKGLAVRLIDTAGIVRYRNRIEKEALRRTKHALREADLVLFVIDGSEPLSLRDRALVQKIKSKKTILVINKSDKHRKMNLEKLGRSFPMEGLLEVSAKTGDNIGALEERIFKTVFDGQPALSEGILISHARHIDILKKSHAFLASAIESLQKKLSLEFVALDLRKALDTLGELTGEVFSENLLDVIFSKFCIGK